MLVTSLLLSHQYKIILQGTLSDGRIILNTIQSICIWSELVEKRDLFYPFCWGGYNHWKSFKRRLKEEYWISDWQQFVLSGMSVLFSFVNIIASEFEITLKWYLSVQLQLWYICRLLLWSLWIFLPADIYADFYSVSSELPALVNKANFLLLTYIFLGLIRTVPLVYGVFIISDTALI